MPAPKPRPTKAKFDLPPLQLADGRQAALLLLRLFELRDKSRNKPMTRVRLTPPMLKRLWNRRRLPPPFVQEVADWLLVAGWVFFDAGPTFAAVRVSAVENWPRVFTKALGKELDDVAAGTYVFSAHEHLLWEGRTLPDGETNVGDDVDGNDGGEDTDATDKTADDNE
jgi:hypothetical protein